MTTNRKAFAGINHTIENILHTTLGISPVAPFDRSEFIEQGMKRLTNFCVVCTEQTYPDNPDVTRTEAGDFRDDVNYCAWCKCARAKAQSRKNDADFEMYLQRAAGCFDQDGE